MEQFGLLLIFLPILLFSVIIHECAHGLIALWHGDPTAKLAGRLTLNPLPHLDLYGSLILPGLLLLSGSRLLFGWAKPVPVQVENLRNPRNDSLKVAAGGPISNLALAFAFALVLSVGSRVLPQVPDAMLLICGYGLFLNCLLAVFNLLPIPPLDGHWVLLRFLPPEAARVYAQIGFMGIFIILILFFVPVVRYFLITLPVGFVARTIGWLAGVPPELLRAVGIPA